MADSNSEGFRGTLRLVGFFARGNRRALAIIASTATIGGFAEAAVLVVIARLAFAVASHDARVKVDLGPFGTVELAVPTLIAIAAGMICVRALLQLVQARITATTSSRVTRITRTQLTRSYLAASWSLQSAERAGRLQQMVGGYSAEASTAVLQLSAGVVALASLLTFLITAFVVSVVAAVAVAVAAAALTLLLRPLRKSIRRGYAQSAAAGLSLGTDVTDTASHVLEARVFGVEDVVGQRIVDGAVTSERLDVRARTLSQIAPVLYQAAAMLLLVGAVGVLYALDVSQVGAIGGVVLIMIRSLTYGQALQSSYQTLHQVAPMLEVLRDELNRYEANAVPRDGDPIERIGDVVFDGVRFEYEPDVPVLRNVSFRVPHGELVGMVGPSGAGKSTLVQLILRLREPTAGTVLVDGRDVRRFALDDWYQRVSFVPQDPALFAGTVAENIGFYREGIDRAMIERAAKLANLHDEVMAWPLGYDAPVGERGSQLSGGQRQRLCIARALVDEPDVLIFDEPTSSLDVKSEALVREAIRGLTPHTTVFIIAHRLSTLSICDRIMVLWDGELQGFDEPGRLEASSPFYREALELSGLR